MGVPSQRERQVDVAQAMGISRTTLKKWDPDRPGDALVIETVDMRADIWVDTTALMWSPKARIIERIRLTDPNTLHNDVTVSAPGQFSHDGRFRRFYLRSDPTLWPDDPERCGGPDDRNPIRHGRVTVELPEDSHK